MHSNLYMYLYSVKSEKLAYMASGNESEIFTVMLDINQHI